MAGVGCPGGLDNGASHQVRLRPVYKLPIQSYLADAQKSTGIWV